MALEAHAREEIGIDPSVIALALPGRRLLPGQLHRGRGRAPRPMVLLDRWPGRCRLGGRGGRVIAGDRLSAVAGHRPLASAQRPAPDRRQYARGRCHLPGRKGYRRQRRALSPAAAGTGPPGRVPMALKAEARGRATDGANASGPWRGCGGRAADAVRPARRGAVGLAPRRPCRRAAVPARRPKRARCARSWTTSCSAARHRWGPGRQHRPQGGAGRRVARERSRGHRRPSGGVFGAGRPLGGPSRHVGSAGSRRSGGCRGDDGRPAGSEPGRARGGKALRAPPAGALPGGWRTAASRPGGRGGGAALVAAPGRAR